MYLFLGYCSIDPIELLTIREENLHYQNCWLLFDYCNALLNKHYFQSCAKFSVISSAQTSQTSTISWDRIMGHSKALLPLLWNQLKERGVCTDCHSFSRKFTSIAPFAKKWVLWWEQDYQATLASWLAWHGLLENSIVLKKDFLA